MMNDRFWHIAQNGKEEGPFSVESICSKIKEGSITSDAYVFKIGTHEWVPITERKEFVDQFSTPPPPPPVEAIFTPALTTESVPTKHGQEDRGLSQSKKEEIQRNP